MSTVEIKIKEIHLWKPGNRKPEVVDRFNTAKVIPRKNGKLDLVFMGKETRTKKKPVTRFVPFFKKEVTVTSTTKINILLSMPDEFAPAGWYLGSFKGKKCNAFVIRGVGRIHLVRGGVTRVSEVLDTKNVYQIALIRTSNFCNEPAFMKLTYRLAQLTSKM